MNEGRAADPPLTPEALVKLEIAVETAEEALGEETWQAERVAAEQAAHVGRAQNRLDVAEAALLELRRAPDTSALSSQVAAGHCAVDVAKAELAKLEAKLGMWLPAGEVVFLQHLPVRVDQVSVNQDSEITGALVTAGPVSPSEPRCPKSTRHSSHLG